MAVVLHHWFQLRQSKSLNNKHKNREENVPFGCAQEI
jgi:hypothetical protein